LLDCLRSSAAPFSFHSNLGSFPFPFGHPTSVKPPLTFFSLSTYIAMKFSVALTSLLFILPLLVADADAAATRRKGGKKNGGNNANATASAAAANSTAVAASSTAAAAAANSTAVLASNNTANNNNNDPQTSLTLDPKVIAQGFASNGQGLNTSKAGQVPSLTSTNNFINFCLTVPNLPITNGLQIKTGSCNPAPMGVIAATTNMPSSKFVNPVNGLDIAPNTAFTIDMNINHLEAGNFVNADSNYYSAPQQVNGAGDIIGHTHFTVNTIASFTDTKPNDPNTFAFFKGVNGAAVGGKVSEDVTKGLPSGFYRLCSMNTDANHTPALVAVAQHGSLDDCVYFSVGQGGAGNAFNGGNSTGSVAVANNATAANSTASGSAAGNSTASGSAAGNATAAGNSTAPPAGQQGGKNQGGKKSGKKGGRGEQPFRLRRQY